MSEFTETHEEIARQLHHFKPAHYRPGIDVGFAPFDKGSLLVVVPPLHTLAVVTYCPGPDLYSVVVSDATPTVREFDGVFCDQLGELVFGADAGQWRLPFGAFITTDADGRVTITEF